MVLDPLAVVALLLLGGAVAVDGTSWGQFMISRPFVAAALGGWIVGAPVQGATIGLVLEALHLTVLPVGAAKHPEGGPASVAAGAVYALSGESSVMLLVLTVVALGLEWVGGESVRLMRTLNVRIVRADEGIANGQDLERRHLLAIGIDFLRGAALVAVGSGVLMLTSRYLVPVVSLDERVAGGAILATVVAMLAGAFRMFGSRFWYAAVGAVVGLVLLALNP